METACFRTMHVHFSHYVVRARLHTIPIRKATSSSVNLFRELIQLDDMTVAKSENFVSGMLRVRSFALMHAPRRVRRHEHVVLKCLSMDSGFRRRFNSGLPRSMLRSSILQAMDDFRCAQISASRL